MNRYVSFTGGKPDFNIDDILWNDEATRLALQEVFRAFGDNYIIQGVTGTTSITAGYIMLDGELLRVDAHTKNNTHFEKVVSYDSGGDVTFNDGTPRQTWQQNRATITAGSGSLDYASADRLEDKIVSIVTGEKILRKKLTFSGWNMDTTGQLTVPHGLTFSKILGAKAYIYNNAVNALDGLDGSDIAGSLGGKSTVGLTDIFLDRSLSGRFDNSNYTNASGFIIVEYDE